MSTSSMLAVDTSLWTVAGFLIACVSLFVHIWQFVVWCHRKRDFKTHFPLVCKIKQLAVEAANAGTPSVAPRNLSRITDIADNVKQHMKNSHPRLAKKLERPE